MMFTRKISPESFDQSLLHHKDQSLSNYRQNIPEDSDPFFTQKIDPETGEVFDRQRPNTDEKIHFELNRGRFENTKLSKLNSLKSAFDKSIPNLALGLVLSIGIAWFGFQLITELKGESNTQNTQLKLIHQGQSQILDAIDSLHDQISNDLEALAELNANPSTQPENIKNSKSELIPPQKKIPPKPRSLKGIKYLGSIKQKDKHQTLLEIDGKVRALSIGDKLKEGWLLSAIDEKNIIISSQEGIRQIISITDASQ